VTRALSWLVGGLMVFAALVVLTAPELGGADEGQLGGLLTVAVIAGVPGLLLLVVLAVRRHRDPDDPHRDDAPPV
jgi:hypothetical protein